MSQPLVSVIIPVYNSADTIGEALESVLSQSCQDYEIIVVDDASTDRTVDVVRAWSAEKNVECGTSDVESEKRETDTVGEDAAVHIQVLRFPRNCGPSAARNRGIAAAKGEWIAFLDGDDAWLPEKLEIQLKCAREQPDVALWCGNTIQLTETRSNVVAPGEAEPECCRIHDSELATVHSLQSTVYSKINLVDFAVGNQVATSTVLVRKSAIEEAGGFDVQFRMAEDYDLWMRIAAKREMVRIEAPLVRYRDRSGSLSMDDRKCLPVVMQVLDKGFGDHGILREYRHLYSAAVSTQLWHASWMAFSRGARWTAIQLLVRARLKDLCAKQHASRTWLRRLLKYLVGRRGV